MDPVTGREQLQADIAQAMRRVELAEARVMGLVRALVAVESVLWYARDAEAQRVFEEAFTAGRALLTTVAGSVENRPPVSQAGAGATPHVDSATRRREVDASGGVDGDEEDDTLP